MVGRCDLASSDFRPLFAAPPDWTVLVVPPMTGCGKNVGCRLPRTETFSEPTECLLAILDELGIECCLLGGDSMGGVVCALFAATHPARTLSMALFFPGGVFRYSSPAKGQFFSS